MSKPLIKMMMTIPTTAMVIQSSFAFAAMILDLYPALLKGEYEQAKH